VTSELIKVVYCDVCKVEGATEYSAVRAVGEPRDVDLCGAHDEPLHALEALLASKGREPSRAPSLPDSHAGGRQRNPAGYLGSLTTLRPEFRTCSLCGTVSPTRQALSAHTRSHHEQALGQLAPTYRCPRGDFAGTYAAVSAHAASAGHSLLLA
jgi:hypothetical protein